MCVSAVCCVINFRFFVFFFSLFLLLRSMDLSIHAAEAMPLESASNRDAASDRDASMRQLEKFTTEAKALTAEL